MERRRAAQPSHKPEPIEARHLEIAENEIGLDFMDRVEGLFPSQAAWARAPESRQPNHSLSCVVVVVHDEDA